MIDYDVFEVTEATQAMSSAEKQQALSAALKKMIEQLGFKQAVYLTKHCNDINGEIVQISTSPNSFLAEFIANKQVTFEYLQHRYVSELQNCWSQNIKVEGGDTVSQDCHIQCCFIQSLSFSCALICAEPVQDLAHDQSHKIAPYMLRINHLLCNKVIGFHRLAQITTDNQNPFNRQLSKRELEVLRWTADGKTADEIAIALSISARTINFHLAQIMNALDVPNKTAAVAKAIIKGWLF